MSTTTRWWFWAVVGLLAGCAPEGSTLSGRVVLSDGSDAAGLVVTLSGDATRAVSTSRDGAFAFERVPRGAWVVAVEAAATREGRSALGVTAPRTDAVELRLTTVGGVAGTVTFGGTPQAGATVTLAGTGASATTDSLGRFHFEGLDTGAVELVATHRAEGTLRAASASAIVTRGVNAELTLPLVEEPPATATIHGAVGFFGAQDPSSITVAVPGTSATANAGADGRFTLVVPPGRWPLVATALQHPQQVLTVVDVRAGETVELPAAVLSFFAPLAEFGGFLGTPTVVAARSPLYLLELTDNGVQKTVLVNSRTRTARVIATASVAEPRFSKTGKYLAFNLGGSLFSYDVASGALSLRGAAGDFTFSSDERVLFLPREPILYRVSLADGRVERFPQTLGVSLRKHTDDRWTVVDVGSNLRLITSTDDVILLTNADRVGLTPAIWAQTGCATSCKLTVVAPDSAVTHEVPLLAGRAVNEVTRAGRFVVFETPDLYLVDLTSGAALRLDDGARTLRFNEDGSRYSYWNRFELFEGPASTTTPIPRVAGAPGLGFGYYLSPTRLVALNTDPAAPSVFDVRAGVSTEHRASDASSLVLDAAAHLVAWRATTGALTAFVGDGPLTRLDEGPATATVSRLRGGARCGVVEAQALGVSWVVNAARTTATWLPLTLDSLPVLATDGFEVLPLRQGSTTQAWDCGHDRLVSIEELPGNAASASGPDEVVVFDTSTTNPRLLRLGVMR
ncbi:MAG: carboxypeptidase regulatory-like domain-containing protein [Myxococcota bacterium]